MKNTSLSISNTILPNSLPFATANAVAKSVTVVSFSAQFDTEQESHKFAIFMLNSIQKYLGGE